MKHPSNTLVSFPNNKTISERPKSGAVCLPSGHARRPVPEDPANLSRRALLGGLPLAGATLTLPFLQCSDAALPTFANGDGEPPHPILALPFVRQSTCEERAAGAPPRCFWAVSPCGVHGFDCGTGTRYAEAALDYMIRERTPYVYQWAVLDMIRCGGPHSGIEIGFLSAFGRLAAEAWEVRMNIHAGDLA